MQQPFLKLAEVAGLENKTPSELIIQYKNDGVIYFPVFESLDICVIARYGSVKKDVTFFKVPELELDALIWKEHHTIDVFKLGLEPFILRDGSNFGFAEYGDIIQGFDVTIGGGLVLERSQLLIDRQFYESLPKAQHSKQTKQKKSTIDKYMEMQARVDEVSENNKRLSHHAICTRIAPEFKCSPDTIRKNTSKPKH